MDLNTNLHTRYKYTCPAQAEVMGLASRALRNFSHDVLSLEI